MVHVWSLSEKNLTVVSVCTQPFSKTRRSKHKCRVTTGCCCSRAKYKNGHTAGEHVAQREVCSRAPLLLGLPLKGHEEEELVARAL